MVYRETLVGERNSALNADSDRRCGLIEIHCSEAWYSVEGA